MKIAPFDSLVWSSLRLAPTTYKIIACIERATVLRANMRVTREYKAGEGVLSYHD